MAGHGSKFGRKKEAAITALLTSRTLEEAARTAGIGTQTLIRWMKLPEFQSAYMEARRGLMSQSNARMQQASSAAVSVLLKIMVDSATSAVTRLRAADRVLVHAQRAIEFEDIAVRLAAVENALAMSKTSDGFGRAMDSGLRISFDQSAEAVK